MRSRYTYAGVGALLLTFACGSKVEIGHGNEGGDGNAAGSGGNGGSAGSEAEGGMPNEAGTGGGIVTAGTGGSTTTGGVFTGGPIPNDNGPQRKVTKVDLLLAVDNSFSMSDKQRLFAKAVPELVQRLVNPPCVNGATVVSQPASPDDACASGERATEPLRDLHIGVITSSLGSHGASGANDVCTKGSDDDHAHLLPTVRTGLTSYGDKGYLKWDPDGTANPPGESDPEALADALGKMVEAAGESGCGYEAQLESVYRFLVDPDPPQAIVLTKNTAITSKQGTDDELLGQREAFLRPDSSVVVLMLTDENDCSVVDEGYGWLVARTPTGTASNIYRATSQCAANPNDACCQSCGEASANDGCPDITTDSECVKGKTLPEADDSMNLRCYEQKRRFGFDLLYPTERYVSGFGGGTVPDRNGQPVENPLFHAGGVDRDPSLFTFAVIGGMPWQDIVTDHESEELTVMTPSQLESQGRWPLLIGDVDNNVPSTDPFMRESLEPRMGKNPITQDSIVPSSSTDPLANAINGHEQINIANSDLQYACTYELPAPVECDQATADEGRGCDCFQEELGFNRSVCNPPDGGAATITQYYGKAYPALRELRVARELGRRTVLGSVCSRNTQDDTRSDYGYRPMFSAIGRRVADTLTKP